MEFEQQYIIQFRFIYNQHLNQLDIKKDLLAEKQAKRILTLPINQFLKKRNQIYL